MEWINVNESKPEEGLEVLVFDSTQGVKIARRDGVTLFWTADENEYLLDYVTHWTALPRPPEGGD